MFTQVILPIKSFDGAKQRLQERYSASERRALAEAMFTDVLAALEDAGLLASTLVFSGDARARGIALDHRARVAGDLDRGHNQAALAGVQDALRRGAGRALLIPGDCPLLEPSEIEKLLARPGTPPSAVIVPDRHGTGTNALLLSPPDVLEPAFGPGSCRRHAAAARAAGVQSVVLELPSLALDVDTPADLEALRAELGSRPRRADRTRSLLAQLCARAA